MQVILLQLDAPLMSFGGVAFDKHKVTNRFPTLSMVTGLIANAMGLGYDEMEKHQLIQDNLEMAARCDRPGVLIIDYQTADLGQEFMLDKTAWTTRGYRERRLGTRMTNQGIHIMYQHYWADAIYTIGFAVDKDAMKELHWTSSKLAEAFIRPSRPLFIGRKCCIPARALFRDKVTAGNPLDALKLYERLPQSTTNVAYRMPIEFESTVKNPKKFLKKYNGQIKVLSDLRDWETGVHCGRRFVWTGFLKPPIAQSGIEECV